METYANQKKQNKHTWGTGGLLGYLSLNNLPPPAFLNNCRSMSCTRKAQSNASTQKHSNIMNSRLAPMINRQEIAEPPEMKNRNGNPQQWGMETFKNLIKPY